MNLQLERLFSDDAARADRQRLAARWRELGLHGDRTIDAVAAWSAAHRPAVRLVFSREDGVAELTMPRLHEQACRLAATLRKLGVGPGDRVATQLPNSPEIAIAYLATLIRGAVVVAMPDTYRQSESSQILLRTRPKVYIAPSSWRGVEAAERLAFVADLAPRPAVILIGDAAKSGAAGGVGVDYLSFAEAIGSAEAGGPAPEAGSVTGEHGADDPAVILFTSGTTSAPKGVLHSHNSLLGYFATRDFPPAGSGAMLRPWAAGHISGVLQVLESVVNGFDGVLMDRWDPQRAVELIDRFAVTAMSGVPTMFAQVTELYGKAGRRSPIAVGHTGGAGVPPSIITRADDLGCRLVRCYGSTEHPVGTFGDLDGTPQRRAAADGPPCRGTEVRVVDERDLPVADGVDGEVLLVGPQQCIGYLDPEANRESFAPGGWFRTGDIGHIDPDGQLVITDRKKDIIIRGGENISSVDVEDVLLRHPAIAEAAAVARAHPLYGEQVCACVLLREGCSFALADAQELFRSAGVAMFKCPEHVEVFDEFPRTPSGKVQKAALRQLLAARAEPA